MERTISVTIGNGCLKHNNRVFVAENVDADRISQNVVFVQRDLREFITNCLTRLWKNIILSRNGKIE